MPILQRTIIIVIGFLTACTPTKQERYELSYEECKNMRGDRSHKFWHQPIAVQSCELIIFEAEAEISDER